MALGVMGALLLIGQVTAPSPARAAGTTYCVGKNVPSVCTAATTFANLDQASRHNYQRGDTLMLQGGAEFRGPLWFDPGESR